MWDKAGPENARGLLLLVGDEDRYQAEGPNI